MSTTPTTTVNVAIHNYGPKGNGDGDKDNSEKADKTSKDETEGDPTLTWPPRFGPCGVGSAAALLTAFAVAATWAIGNVFRDAGLLNQDSDGVTGHVMTLCLLVLGSLLLLGGVFFLVAEAKKPPPPAPPVVKPTEEQMAELTAEVVESIESTMKELIDNRLDDQDAQEITGLGNVEPQDPKKGAQPVPNDASQVPEVIGKVSGAIQGKPPSIILLSLGVTAILLALMTSGWIRFSVDTGTQTTTVPPTTQPLQPTEPTDTTVASTSSTSTTAGLPSTTDDPANSGN